MDGAHESKVIGVRVSHDLHHREATQGTKATQTMHLSLHFLVKRWRRTRQDWL